MANTPRTAKLGQLASTAICGNDITSSCLYVSALAIGYGGRWAPICLVLVAATLYLFRSIYAEVVGALPLNGGAYNALLNTTSKYRASIAACLTVLSYMATAVISSNEAMHYHWHHRVVQAGDRNFSVSPYVDGVTNHSWRIRCNERRYRSPLEQSQDTRIRWFWSRVILWFRSSNVGYIWL